MEQPCNSKSCDLMHKSLEDKIATHNIRINRYGERLDILEQEIVGIKKDTSRLEELLNRLEVTIESLKIIINDLKLKPLQKYEQVLMMATSALVGYIISRYLNM